MARIKKVQDLNEDKSIRSVKLHFHRFSRFLRYLKENDAVIELKVESDQSGLSFKQIYTASKRDGNPSIEDLVADALNISGSMARDYTNRRLGMDDKHSDGDKIYATGKVIEAITMYLDSDGPKDEDTQRLLSSRLFAKRDGSSVEPFLEYNKNFYPFGSTEQKKPLYLASEYKAFQKMVVESLRLLPVWMNDLTPENLPEHHFRPLFRQLSSVYGNTLTPNVKTGTFGLIRILKKLESLYCEFNGSNRANQLLIPGYIDFSIPFNKDHAMAASRSIFREKLDVQQINGLTLEEILLYRYEILWRIQEEQIYLSEFGNCIHGALLLTMAEFVAYEMLIDNAVEKVLRDLRFVIYYSDLNHGPNLQQDSINLSEVSEILSRYNFRNGLESSIDISGSNLLNTSILKFPEPHVAKGGYPVHVIEGLIKRALKDHFDTRVRADLNFPFVSW